MKRLRHCYDVAQPARRNREVYSRSVVGRPPIQSWTPLLSRAPIQLLVSHAVVTGHEGAEKSLESSGE